MKISHFELFTAQSKLEKPISDATHTLTEISFIVLRLHGANGIFGEASLLSFQYSRQAILGALKDQCPLVIGVDASETMHVFHELDKGNEYFGLEGINRWAQAAINIAMWDAWSKHLKQPVWKLLGGSAKPVTGYGSGGWISYTKEELLDEVTGYTKRGFNAVKIKVGKPDWQEDLERLHWVRDAVGPQVNIMMDANQGYTVPKALALSKAAANIGIQWFEEPVDHTDFEGYSTLRNHAGISLAMGEREYSSVPLRELLSRNAIDIWQPDILRIGGVEGWRNSAALAGAHQVPVLPHFYKEYDIALLCTIPNGAGVESFDWMDPLIDHPLKFNQEGKALPSELPGWGFTFKEECLQAVNM